MKKIDYVWFLLVIILSAFMVVRELTNITFISPFIIALWSFIILINISTLNNIREREQDELIPLY